MTRGGTKQRQRAEELPQESRRGLTGRPEGRPRLKHVLTDVLRVGDGEQLLQCGVPGVLGSLARRRWWVRRTLRCSVVSADAPASCAAAERTTRSLRAAAVPAASTPGGRGHRDAGRRRRRDRPYARALRARGALRALGSRDAVPKRRVHAAPQRPAEPTDAVFGRHSWDTTRLSCPRSLLFMTHGAGGSKRAH